MPRSDVISVLNKYLTDCARSAVVRLRDPALAPSSDSGNLGIFTGFFVSPNGHLLTAFHPLKHKLWDTERTARFELGLEFDALGSPGKADSVRVNAEYAPGCCDFKADWALLKLDYAPGGYLPVAEADRLRPPQVDLCSAVRAYGFTEDQPDVAVLGAYEGQFARTFPERSQFRVGFVDRGVGQSGGPVIDLASRTVVGVVSGLYQRQELLTADAAIIDLGTFAGLDLGIDMAKSAYDWRGLAAEFLSSNLTEFRLLATDHSPPSLPGTHLRGRDVSRRLASLMADGGESVTVIHGARGSGKTTLAIETANRLTSHGIVNTVFWYDFDQAKKRTGSELVPALALHLMRTQGAFEPLEQFAYDGPGGDVTETLTALITALRDGSHLLVFENAHYPLREQRSETLLLLERIAQAAAIGRSRVLFTSWDSPQEPLNFPRYPVQGLASSELSAYFRLYGLSLSTKAISYISDYADDIVCLEMFVRSPEWRAAIEADQDLPREPDRLLSYWVTRYTNEHVPASALRILLALAVLEQPADYDMLEAVSAVEHFHKTLDLLRSSPPLINTGETTASGHIANGISGSLYSAHKNVRRAVLTTSDKAQIIATNERAAVLWADRRDFAAAARHRLRSSNPTMALTLIRDNRDAIIAAGRLDDLESLTDDLLESSRESSDALYALHVIRASCSNIRGDYVAACKHWSFALRNPPDALSAAMVYNRRADSYRLSSEYGLAANDYLEAEALTNTNRTAVYLRELGRARLGLAKLDRLKGDYAQARAHYALAHDSFEECFDEQGMVETSFGLGEVSRLASDWPVARQAYSESLARARKAGNTEREAYALWGLGEVLRLTEDYTTSEQIHRQGLDKCLQVNDTRSTGWAYLGLAETHRATGALDSARLAYQQALDQFALTKSDTEIAHGTLGWCEAERAQGRLHFDRYDVTEQTYRNKELRHCLLLCLTSKAAALRINDRKREASECLEEAHRLALEAGLEHELSVISSMQASPTAVPPLPLNFP